VKEYVYLDMDLINSYLAQLDEGILTKMVTGMDTLNGHRNDDGKDRTKDIQGQAGVPGVANGKTGYSVTNTEKRSSVYSETNSELIETVLNDYSLDVLLDNLNNNELINNQQDTWIDGDFVSIYDTIKVFNFPQLKDSVTTENLQNVLFYPTEYIQKKEEYDKLTKNKSKNKSHTIKRKIKTLEKELTELDPFSNFESVERFANYMSVLFPDTILIKIGNTLSMCSTELIRMNIPTLSLLALTKRKFNILGVVIAKNEKDLTPKDGEQWSSTKIASESTVAFMDVMLFNFGISQRNDYYIRPVAIYYDSK